MDAEEFNITEGDLPKFLEYVEVEISGDNGPFPVLALADGDYHILTRAQFADFITAVSEVYAHLSDEDIELWNMAEEAEWIASQDRMPDYVGQPDTEGYVYVFESNGLYKIGMSKDPEKRLIGLKTTLPTEINMVVQARVENYRQVERDLHAAYDKCRVWGEWFKLDSKEAEELTAKVWDLRI